MFENVKPDDGSLICGSLDGHAETERRCTRINHNSVTGILRLKLLPESQLLRSGVGTTFDQFSGIYRGSSKQPDHYPRVDTDPPPRIIVESGWSESFPHPRHDKGLWLPGDRSVVLVILLRWTAISNGRIKGCAEVWRQDALRSLVSSIMSILPAPSPLPPAKTIQFIKGELFGDAMVPGTNPNTILDFDLAKLRRFAEEVVTKMKMQPA